MWIVPPVSQLEWQDNAIKQAARPTFVPDMNAIHADFWLLERVVAGAIIFSATRSIMVTCPSCCCEYLWSANPTGGGRDPETDEDTCAGGAIDAQKIVNANTDVDDTMLRTVCFYVVRWDTDSEILKLSLTEIIFCRRTRDICEN